VVLTGGSSGIGAALAQAMSAAGARMALMARRAEGLKETAGRCPGQVALVAGDVTRDQDRRELVRAAKERWGRVDILVNNAGRGSYGPFLTTGEEVWRELFEVNLFAAVALTREVLPLMLAQGQGLIVNLASIAGLAAHTDQVVPYVASKHALVGFSRGLARDLEGTGVRVKAVCPHLTDTGFFATGPGAEEMAPVAARYRAVMDTPQEVAQGILRKLDQEGVILLPTEAPARAWDRLRDI